jgi:DUF2892 family protein
MTLAESFGKSAFAQLVNSPAGRIARVVVGLGLISWGYLHRAESAGIVTMVLGLVPLAAGAFNLCFISALLGGPLSGARIAESTRTS